MSPPNLSHTLLSLLAVQGIDLGDSIATTPGERTAASRDGEPLVTLVLDGVAARQGPDRALSRGLAAAGDLINFDAVLGGQADEIGQWLTPGRQLPIPAARLVAAIDRPTLIETTIADLRARNAALQGEVARHAGLRVVDRVAALLLDVHDLGGGDILGLRQSDLAALLSVRRASVSTACSDLQAVGAVRIRRGGVQIMDVAALRQTVGDAPIRP